MTGRIVLPLALAIAAYGQTADPAYRRMLESKEQVTAFLVHEARAITDRAGQEILSVDNWEKQKARRLEEMRDMLGLLPWPKRTPLNVKVTGTLDEGSYTIEKIAFESLPKFYVTANLYIPKNRKGPAPAVVYVCGHAGDRNGSKAYYQRHGISFAKNGYVAIILDPIQIAETFSWHHGVYWAQMYDWYARGYSPAGPEVWNAMRAIDYLETRPEVDKARIGITGRSGGAAMSWFTAAVDPRLKIAAPIMGISTYAADVRENSQKLHCDCMFPINAWLHDMIHQGALIAPRPLLFGEGKRDKLFPVEGYMEFYAKVGALYKGYGQQEAFRMVEVDTAHQDSDFLREQVIQFFDQHLWKIPKHQLQMSYVNQPAEKLAVFPEGPPADAQNFRIHETFTTRPPSPRWPALSAWEARRKALLEDLRAKVFAAVPRKPRNVRVEQADNELRLSSDDTIPVRALLRKPPKPGPPMSAVLYIASDGDDPASIDKMMTGVNAVRLIVYPRGVGEIAWDRAFYRDTMRNAMFVGQTVDSMRLADVFVALEALRRQPDVDPQRIMTLGRGASGILGLYAAILDPGIQQVMLVEPPSTHAEASTFLNILRHTDLPEAAALLAPRHLSFFARVPDAFDYTRHVYSLYGKPENFFRSMDIRSVVEGLYDHNKAPGL